MRNNLENWCRQAIDLVNEQTEFSVYTKSSEDDLVTSVDRNLELMLHGLILEHNPTHQIVGEEHGLVGEESDHLWIIDPIDGTTNFVKQGKDFGTLIAYYYQRQPVLGALVDICNQDVYIAEINQGLFKNGVKIAGPNPLSLAASLVSFDPAFTPHFKPFKQPRDRSFKMRYIGACSLDSLGVVTGDFGVFVSHQGYVWDYAVPYVFAKVLGLGICRLNGDEFDPFTASDMILCNAEAYPEVRELIYE